jgi:hypothetical protein
MGDGTFVGQMSKRLAVRSDLRAQCRKLALMAWLSRHNPKRAGVQNVLPAGHAFTSWRGAAAAFDRAALRP